MAPLLECANRPPRDADSLTTVIGKGKMALGVRRDNVGPQRLDERQYSAIARLLGLRPQQTRPLQQHFFQAVQSVQDSLEGGYITPSEAEELLRQIVSALVEHEVSDLV